jgi:hypothetical protein
MGRSGWSTGDPGQCRKRPGCTVQLRYISQRTQGGDGSSREEYKDRVCAAEKENGETFLKNRKAMTSLVRALVTPRHATA